MGDYEAEIISVTTEDGKFGFSTSEFHKEELKEAADEMGVSLSQACRHWISVGRKLNTELDPRDDNINHETGDEPLVDLVYEYIPEGEENAMDIDEVIELIQEQVNNEFLDIIQDDERIQRDNWEVYK
jgi:hypothetical protein